ncbi:hypothetical protein SDC9_209747 [bioreactor metagenome]|uniref:Uncharacterized protein n=1 Tax=bioreactor metagenome TaxID=1076179 RepID=A0A645JEI7_9ZZZZ
MHAVDKQRDQQTDDHFEGDGKERELHRIHERLTEIAVLDQGGIVFEQDKVGIVHAFEIVVIGKTVDQRKDERVRRHDQQHDQRWRDHCPREYALFHAKRLHIPCFRFVSFHVGNPLV